MPTLSIRGLDQETARRLKAEAQRRGLSVNAFLLRVIREQVGLRPEGPRRPRHHDLDYLAGTWSQEEAAELLANVSDFERVDEELWGP